MCLLAKKRKGLKSFLAESRGKNWNYLFYPSAKSRRELKIKTLGVTFRGASAYYVQKSIAPQKQAVCQFSDEKILWRNFLSKIFAIFFFSTSKNEMLGIVWNAFSQSFTPIGAIFGRFRTVVGGARIVSGAEKKSIWSRRPRLAASIKCCGRLFRGGGSGGPSQNYSKKRQMKKNMKKIRKNS